MSQFSPACRLHAVTVPKIALISLISTQSLRVSLNSSWQHQVNLTWLPSRLLGSCVDPSHSSSAAILVGVHSAGLTASTRTPFPQLTCPPVGSDGNLPWEGGDHSQTGMRPSFSLWPLSPRPQAVHSVILIPSGTLIKVHFYLISCLTLTEKSQPKW